MAKSGIRHIDVGDELTKAEWESEQSHALVHGNAFPAGPVERQLFYRDDEHRWYIYNDTDWITTDVSAHAALTTGIHGVGALHVAGFHAAGQAVSKVIWKDTFDVVLDLAAQTIDIDWTDIDLTANTSPNAKIALVRLYLRLVDGGTAGANFLGIRKKGTTDYWGVEMTNALPDGMAVQSAGLIGLDAGQVIEYSVTVATAGTPSLRCIIFVMGYIE
ncbi:unnamed protein product [marine sediment metagenome]|uniref:Uncharacterized protein n=1 Tax=marine sediment metagenome TaxID=412755 RepID=X1FZL3_9ZZZZ